MQLGIQVQSDPSSCPGWFLGLNDSQLLLSDSSDQRFKYDSDCWCNELDGSTSLLEAVLLP
jgi:hypothetical protein